MPMRKLKNYKPTRFMAKTSSYNKEMADYAVMFIESLTHTKGTWAGKPFELIDWQERIIRDLFGVLKPNGYRQFNTAYIEIPKKMGKSELAAAVFCQQHHHPRNTQPQRADQHSFHRSGSGYCLLCCISEKKY